MFHMQRLTSSGLATDTNQDRFPCLFLRTSANLSRPRPRPAAESPPV